MKAEELRIGNYLKNFLGEFFEVNLSTLEMFSSGNFKGFNKPEPIELTEEILLKCGFVRDGNTDYYTCRKVGFTINLSGIIGYRTCIWSNKHIKHLHQLQNLYYALCNEELNVEL